MAESEGSSLVPPRPRRRRLNSDQQALRDRLVGSFNGFSASTVSTEHIDCAKNFIHNGGPARDRYRLINFNDILERNEHKPDHLTMMTSAYDLLLKYVINLLKPKRPQVWRSIKTNNTAFKARVDCMEGARDILRTIGYEERTENAMQFPESVTEPNAAHLYAVAAELLMAKLEVEDKEEKRGRSGQLPSSQQQLFQFSTDSEEAMPLQSHTRTDWHQLNGSNSGQFYTQQLNNKPRPETSHPASSRTPNRSPQPKPRQKTLSTSSESSSMDASSLQVQQPSQQSQQQPSLSSSSGGSTSDLTTASESSPLSSIGEVTAPPSSTAVIGRFKKEKDKLSELRKKREALKQQGGKTAFVSSKVESEPGRRMKIISAPIESHLVKIPVSRPSEAAREAELATIPHRQPEKPSPDIKYPPRNRQHPQFHGDVIPEEDERKISQPLSEGSSDSLLSTGSGPFCEKCKCKLSAANPVCAYCNTPKNQPDNPPEIPPRSKHKPADDPIPRATPQGLEEATKQYRMSQIQNTVAFTPQFRQPIHPAASPAPHPQLPPTSVNAAASLGGQPQQPYTTFPPNSSSSVVPPRPHPRGDVQNVAAASERPVGPSESSEPKTITGQSWTEMMREKQEAWKQKQLKDGVKPKDLKPLDDGPAYRKDQQQREREPGLGRKSVDPSKFKRERLGGNTKQYENEEKVKKRMQQMETDGAHLLHWVKLCGRHNYSMDEVQIAFDEHRAEEQKDPLDYLQTKWERKISDLRLWVSSAPESVGYPSEVEARRFLVEAKGNIQSAVDACHAYRIKMIEELRQKMRRGGKDLPWEAAMHALTASDMDVDKACWTVQCGELQPLYDYIFSEWSKVKQTDMMDIKELIKRGDLEDEIRYRLLMGEYKFESHDRAKLVIELMKEVETQNVEHPLHYYIEAAKDFQTLETAKTFLFRTCCICYDDAIPTHEMVNMPGCTDELCKECFKAHFVIIIKEKTVKHFNCPICGEPDLANRDMGQEIYLELFVSMIRQHLDQESYELCQQKLRDFSLSKEPGFCWCANETCRSGFINDRDQTIKKLQCPGCSKFMCFQCKKPWEEQHKGLSCEQFAQWKQANDPEAQEQGLAAHLRANGIECPACHMRYDLARGGCMHFKCTQCPNEFCSGCGQSFRQGQQCKKFESCANKGLHAHHPRDCLFYLRDFDVPELQAFLRDNNIKFDTEPPQAQIEAARQKAAQAVGGAEEPEEVVEVKAEPAKEKKGEKKGEKDAQAPAKEEAKVELKCCVPLQKEGVDGLQDEECGREVPDGHAGICVVHYKEYLVTKINQAKLDPITMYDTDKVKVILLREEMEVPDKEDDEDDDNFRERLIEHVKERVQLPLARGEAANDAKAA